jgi:hypothetical protein
MSLDPEVYAGHGRERARAARTPAWPSVTLPRRSWLARSTWPRASAGVCHAAQAARRWERPGPICFWRAARLHSRHPPAAQPVDDVAPALLLLKYNGAQALPDVTVDPVEIVKASIARCGRSASRPQRTRR